VTVFGFTGADGVTFGADSSVESTVVPTSSSAESFVFVGMGAYFPFDLYIFFLFKIMTVSLRQWIHKDGLGNL
jgi:hypothetical protein